MSVRKVGVEEELMLVDPLTGELAAVSHRVLKAGRLQSAAGHSDESDPVESEPQKSAGFEAIEQELFLQQLETATAPCTELSEVAVEIRRCRAVATAAAQAAGVEVVASGTPVLGGFELTVTPKPRYRLIFDQSGEIGRHALACGMHVHVDVADDEEGVGVLDRIRPWLPVLLAVSANSPYAEGQDSGFASWRSQVWGRWPTAGPTEAFGDAATYHQTADALVETGAALDRGMLYYDARLSESYATVEVRVADVCTEIEDTVLLVALSRGLVETAARSFRAGDPAPRWRSDVLRAAHWRSAHSGLADSLVHPVQRRLRPAREVVEDLIEHVSDALDEAGDLEQVRAGFEKLLARGAGASRQRAVAEAAGGDLRVVVMDLVRRTQAAEPA